jgi:hypothetical protein
MPTKISNLTSYDGDVLNGSEILPLTETDEGATEGITVSQLATGLPDTQVNGTFTHSPSVDATDAAVFQDAAGNALVEMDTTNGKMVVRDPGGTAGADEMRFYDDGVSSVIETGHGGVKVRTNGSLQYQFGSNAFTPRGSNQTLGIHNELWNSFYTESPIKDSGDNELLGFASNSSAVNYFQVSNAASGSAPTLSAVGGDANIDVEAIPKGSGAFRVQAQTNSAKGIRFLRYSDSGRAQMTYENEKGGEIWRIGLTAGGDTTFNFYDQSTNVLELEQAGDAFINPVGQVRVGDITTPSDLLEAAGTVRAEGGTRSASPSVGDDSVSTVTPDRSRVKVHVYDGSGESGEATLDVSSGTVVNTNYSSTNLTFTTGNLGGTTGTDGNLTISADGTNNTIDIENRTGSTKTVTLSIIG